MTLIILTCLALTLCVPLLVALMESHRARLNLKDDGAWTLARALAGGVHIRWRPDPTPVVWFELDGGVPARVHTYQRAGQQGMWIEARAYLTAPLHLAARLSTPATAPLDPSLPGLTSYEPSKESRALLEDLKAFSIETNDRKRLEQCLLTSECRAVVTGLRAALKLDRCEVLILNQVLVARALSRRQVSAGELFERTGPQLAEALRALSATLLDLAAKGRSPTLGPSECPLSAAPLAADADEVWACPSCGRRAHRSAVELLMGCCDPWCEEATDGVSAEVVRSTRPFIRWEEVEVEPTPAPAPTLDISTASSSAMR
ncbi:MAG: hypothetical protein FJ138_06480 [Deltaproteobacteria bacterium]|nr:hypothetical protein [Deltaproteobacteria bacterium]